MKTNFYLSLGLAAVISCSQPSSTDKNNGLDDFSYSDDPCTQFDEVDRQMLDMVETIKSKHADDAIFLERFKMEQVFWIQYRDRHLRALYPRDWDRHFRKKFGKEVFNPCKCKELTRFTMNRIKELEHWLEGGVKGQDECPSFWNDNAE